jgi:hypothetical protein
MELKTAIEILEYHQEWRLGERDEMIHEPKKLTEALDIVIKEVVKQFKKNRLRALNGWVAVADDFPEHLQTVWLTNGKGWVGLGCRVEDPEGGWHWAESNGLIYIENGEIVSECESEDLDVIFWHPLPKPPQGIENKRVNMKTIVPHESSNSCADTVVRTALSKILKVAASMVTTGISAEISEWDLSKNTPMKTKRKIVQEADKWNDVNRMRAIELKEAFDVLSRHLR